MGLITMSSAALIPDFLLVDSHFDAVGPNGSCSLIGGTSLYVPFGTTFSTTTVIWTNSNGTGVPAAGWYSVGGVVRQWDGVSFLGASSACLPIFEVQLGYHLSVGATACVAVTSTYYAKDSDFAATDNIWSVADPLTDAIAGWYSDGLISREWNGTDFIGLAVPCP